MARQASCAPSRENTGCVSHAGLPSVRLRSPLPSAATSYKSKLVDHGSDLPLRRAENTSFEPSGENVYSLASPNGLEGTSASSAALTDTGSVATPLLSLSTNSCEIVPLLQVSQ